MTALDPDSIRTRAFSSGLRGLDRDEVATFLSEVADAYESTLKRSPSFKHLGEEAGILLQAACDGAESLRRKGEEDANRILLDGHERAKEEARAITAHAEEDAAAARAD